MRTRWSGWGAAALGLLVGGPAWAQGRPAPGSLPGSAQGQAAQEVTLSGAVLDGDGGTISGTLAEQGRMVGSFRYTIEHAGVRDGELVLTGAFTAVAQGGTQTLDDVSVTLSEASGLCQAAAATPEDLDFDRLGLMAYSVAIDLNLTASLPQGQVLTNTLCAATHVLDEPRTPLLPAVTPLLALANRSLGYVEPSGNARATSATATVLPRLPTTETPDVNTPGPTDLVRPDFDGAAEGTTGQSQNGRAAAAPGYARPSSPAIRHVSGETVVDYGEAQPSAHPTTQAYPTAQPYQAQPQPYQAQPYQGQPQPYQAQPRQAQPYQRVTSPQAQDTPRPLPDPYAAPAPATTYPPQAARRTRHVAPATTPPDPTSADTPPTNTYW